MDIDFQDDRREEVIEYVRRKYGEECVSNIITYGSMKSKSAIRDVARIYDHEPAFGDRIAKLVPDKVKNLKQALEESEEFSNMYNANSEVKAIVDTAITIEGLPKSTGKHACFDKETLITTDKGLKRIVDVEIGDNVLTHKLRFKPVVDLIETQTDKVYTLNIEGLNPIKVTGNHPMYVKCGYMSENAIWKEVSKLNVETDYLAIPLDELGNYTDEDLSNNEELFFSDQLLWINIKSIECSDLAQPMYNLTILDDSSYIAGGLVAHNCGVIIAPEPITNFIPQVVVMDETGEKDAKGNKEYEEVMVTQLDMAECEEMGLLKMDFLGLRNLSVIAGTLELINKNRLVEGLPLLTMDDIPITDPFAFKHIQQGNTIGVFQLESGGMTNLVSETYPDVDNYVREYIQDKKVNEKGIGIFDERFDALFERLIALISLYRPGPMDEIPNYLHNMNNPDDVTYDAPQLKNILSNTYGIIVYQEQVMHAVRQMAGFSAGQSDVIRKAMGKKIEYIVDEYGEYFIYGSEESDKKRIREGQEPYNIKGCINNGISEEVAKETWDKMYKFAKYAFNKSHRLV